MVEYNGSMYRYVHNLQGDIVGIIDSAGSLVVEYRYDAWGKPLSVMGTLADTLGKRNPFRYRGYVYDEETGLYYLRSRYYNPEIGRFVNADTLLGSIGGVGSHNVFAYCLCSPILYTDHSGYGVLLDAIKSIWASHVEATIQTPQMQRKLSVSLASNVGLSVKSYPLANKLFSHFLWGNGATLDSETKNEISTAIGKSVAFAQKIVSDYAEQACK